MTDLTQIRQNQRECQALRQADVFPDGPRAGQSLTDADREGATRGMEDWVGGGGGAMNHCCCIRCPDCDGTGRVRVECDDVPYYDLEHCLECDGSGYVDECDYCSEQREISESKWEVDCELE